MDKLNKIKNLINELNQKREQIEKENAISTENKLLEIAKNNPHLISLIKEIDDGCIDIQLCFTANYNICYYINNEDEIIIDDIQDDISDEQIKNLPIVKERINIIQRKNDDISIAVKRLSRQYGIDFDIIYNYLNEYEYQ